MVDSFGARAGEPFRREEAIRVAGSGDVVFGELLGLRGGPGAECLNVDFHAEGVGETGDLSTDGAVSQDAPGYFDKYINIDEGPKKQQMGEEEVPRRLTFEDQESRWLCR